MCVCVAGGINHSASVWGWARMPQSCPPLHQWNSNFCLFFKWHLCCVTFPVSFRWNESLPSQSSYWHLHYIAISCVAGLCSSWLWVPWRKGFVWFFLNIYTFLYPLHVEQYLRKEACNASYLSELSWDGGRGHPIAILWAGDPPASFSVCLGFSIHTHKITEEKNVSNSLTHWGTRDNKAKLSTRHSQSWKAEHYRTYRLKTAGSDYRIRQLT